MPPGKAECVSARTSQRRKATGSWRGSTAYIHTVETRIVWELILEEFWGNGKWGAEPCCRKSSFYFMLPTISLFTAFPFQGTKFCFPDKQNHCTVKQINSHELFRNQWATDNYEYCFCLAKVRYLCISNLWPLAYIMRKNRRCYQGLSFCYEDREVPLLKNNIPSPQQIHSFLTFLCSSDQIIKQPSLFIPSSAKDMSSVSEKHPLTIIIIIMTSQQVDTIMPENHPHNYTVL